MDQKIKTPEIEKCAKCGSRASCIDWDFNMLYRVICDKNHVATGKCLTRHKAICKWNTQQKIIGMKL
jgi:hypothetical protein